MNNKNEKKNQHNIKYIHSVLFSTIQYLKKAFQNDKRLMKSSVSKPFVTEP